MKTQDLKSFVCIHFREIPEGVVDNQPATASSHFGIFRQSGSFAAKDEVSKLAVRTYTFAAGSGMT